MNTVKLEYLKLDFESCIRLSESYILLGNFYKAEEFLLDADCVRDSIYDLQKSLGVPETLDMDQDMAEKIAATRRLLKAFRK